MLTHMPPLFTNRESEQRLITCNKAYQFPAIFCLCCWARWSIRYMVYHSGDREEGHIGRLLLFLRNQCSGVARRPLWPFLVESCCHLWWTESPSYLPGHDQYDYKRREVWPPRPSVTPLPAAVLHGTESRVVNKIHGVTYPTVLIDAPENWLLHAASVLSCGLAINSSTVYAIPTLLTDTSEGWLLHAALVLLCCVAWYLIPAWSISLWHGPF